MNVNVESLVERNSGKFIKDNLYEVLSYLNSFYQQFFKVSVLINTWRYDIQPVSSSFSQDLYIKRYLHRQNTFHILCRCRSSTQNLLRFHPIIFPIPNPKIFTFSL